MVELWEFPKNWGYPNSWMVRKDVQDVDSPTKIDENWGYPNFRKPPYVYICN